jgi:NAD(P) transhydrogenase
MVEEIHVDLAVIGAGPAGEKGALQAAQEGKKVVLVDRMGMLGGSCLHQGTIPSKALRLAILDITGFQLRAFYGDQSRHDEISMPDLQERLFKVVAEENGQIENECKDAGVKVIYGSASFRDRHCLEVFNADSKLEKRINFSYALIATGSRPRHPIEIPEDSDVFLDSDHVFRMKTIPDRLIVVGAGVIGCEYATMFAALGVEVTLVDRRNGILRMLDEEIGDLFSNEMQKMGIDVRLGLGDDIVELSHAKTGQAQVVFRNGSAVEAPYLFYSMGRLANVDGLKLEEIGIELEDGHIPVNPLFQTVCPHIYAAGDVIGLPALASTSMEQGRLSVRNAFAMGSHHFPKIFPIGIYGVPEISSVGSTEKALKERGINYEVGRAKYSEIARGPMAGDTSGLVKLLFHSETLELLGVHIIGTNATEIIPIGHMAMNFRVRIDYFVDQVFNYPTFSEGFRAAALDGLRKTKRENTK